MTIKQLTKESINKDLTDMIKAIRDTDTSEFTASAWRNFADTKINFTKLALDYMMTWGDIRKRMVLERWDTELELVRVIEQQRASADLNGGRFDKNNSAFNHTMKMLGLMSEEGGTQGDLIITKLSDREITVLGEAFGVPVIEMLEARDSQEEEEDEYANKT